MQFVLNPEIEGFSQVLFIFLYDDIIVLIFGFIEVALRSDRLKIAKFSTENCLFLLRIPHFGVRENWKNRGPRTLFGRGKFDERRRDLSLQTPSSQILGQVGMRYNNMPARRRRPYLMIAIATFISTR